MREAAVAAFEARHGVRLPSEFRCCVRLIGDGTPRSLVRRHPWDVALALPWGQHLSRDDPRWPHGDPFWRGSIRGGGLWLTGSHEWGGFVLAVSGPEPGTVWLSLPLREHMRPTGLGFFAWYERCLDEQLVAVGAEDETPHLKRRLSGTREDGPVMLRLARAATLRGDAVLAARALARARALGYELDDEAMRDLVRAVTTRDNHLAIASRISIVLTAGFPLPPPALRLDLGQHLVALGRHAEAVAVLEPLLQEAPPALRDSRALAEALESVGRAEQAYALVGPKQGRRWHCEWRTVRCLVALGRLREAQAGRPAGCTGRCRAIRC